MFFAHNYHKVVVENNKISHSKFVSLHFNSLLTNKKLIDPSSYVIDNRTKRKVLYKEGSIKVTKYRNID